MLSYQFRYITQFLLCMSIFIRNNYPSGTALPIVGPVICSGTQTLYLPLNVPKIINLLEKVQDVSPTLACPTLIQYLLLFVLQSEIERSIDKNILTRRNLVESIVLTSHIRYLLTFFRHKIIVLFLHRLRKHFLNVEKFKLMEQYHQYNQSFLHLKNTFNEEKKLERDRKIEQEMLGNFYTFKTLSGHEHWRGQLLLNKQDQTSNRYDSILLYGYKQKIA